jgi:pyruvate/2-oxoglutarate dehydrogenase complex dihydrolipoamide acyltransferase (E2) component
MAYEFKLPDLGEGLTEGEIAKWLVAEGDEIAEDAPLVEIQTDKTTVEIPSPAAGKVARILVAEGDVVPVGTVLVVIGDGAVPLASNSLLQAEVRTATAPVPEAAGRVQATPLVRRIAQELGVELASVTATGPGGRVSESDVRNAASNSLLQASEGRREKVRGVRRQIVEHLTRAHHEVPAVTYVEECDFSNVDLKLLLPTVLKATAATATTSASRCRPIRACSCRSCATATRAASNSCATTSPGSPSGPVLARSLPRSYAARRSL